MKPAGLGDLWPSINRVATIPVPPSLPLQGQRGEPTARLRSGSAHFSIRPAIGLAGCAAIDELRDTILRWVESEKLPSGRGAFADDLPDATPVVPPEKPAKKEASKTSKKQDKSARKLQRPQSVTIAAAEEREQPKLWGPQANLIVMRPIDENRDDALIFTGIGSLFTAIAAVLLDYPMFATIFAFFSAFAVAVALRNEWEHRR